MKTHTYQTARTRNKLIALAISFVLGLLLTTSVYGQCGSTGIHSYSPAATYSQPVYRTQIYSPIRNYVSPSLNYGRPVYSASPSNVYRAPRPSYRPVYSNSPGYSTPIVSNPIGSYQRLPSTLGYQSFQGSNFGSPVPVDTIQPQRSCSGGSCPLN